MNDPRDPPPQARAGEPRDSNALISKDLLIQVHGLTVEQDKSDHPNLGAGIADGVEGYGSRQVFREAIDSGGDGREGNARDAQLICNFKAAAVAGGQQSSLSSLSALPNRADGVDYPFGRQAEARRGFGIAGVAPTEQPAGLQKLRSCCPVDRSIHPTATQKGPVGGIDDRIDLLDGDVTGHQLDVKIVGALRCHPNLTAPRLKVLKAR
jgi:hypothetical protein